jgi:hypothetical protein
MPPPIVRDGGSVDCLQRGGFKRNLWRLAIWAQGAFGPPIIIVRAIDRGGATRFGVTTLWMVGVSVILETYSLRLGSELIGQSDHQGLAVPVLGLP